MQGPCHANQEVVGSHDTHGIDIITGLLINEPNPLWKDRLDLALRLKVCVVCLRVLCLVRPAFLSVLHHCIA